MPARMLRHALRSVPTPVVVACTTGDAGPVGHTIGSFVSVSLDPPLVGYFAGRGSGTLEAIRRSGAFSVNVLAAHQGELARGFAQHSGDRRERFAGVAWRPGPHGCPHLVGAVVVLDCELHDVLPAGDHELVLGRVTAATAAVTATEPLVFAEGGFTTLAGPVPEPPDAPAWERAG